LARLAVFDCKNVPSRPSWRRTLCGFYQRPVYVQAATVAPTVSPPSLIMDVRIERPTGGWRRWRRCGAGLPQLSLRDSLDWPVRTAREGFHFLPLADVLCPFSAEAEPIFPQVLINAVLVQVKFYFRSPVSRRKTLTSPPLSERGPTRCSAHACDMVDVRWNCFQSPKGNSALFAALYAEAKPQCISGGTP